jgi:hypothetical protein
VSTELPGLADVLDPFDPVQADRANLKIYETAIDADEQLQQFLQARKQAYANVFGKRDDPYVQFVLEDLARFAKAFQPPFNPDQRIQDVLIGRAEVFWRIFDHSHLTVEDLYRKYTDAHLKQQEQRGQ